MAEKLYTAMIDRVPHSSVVGSSIKVVMEGVGVVALLMISVPQPHLDYKTVADAVAKAILNEHVSRRGTMTLVLPDDFVERAKEAVS